MKNRYLEIPDVQINRKSTLYLQKRSTDVESEFDCHLENFYRQMQYSNQYYQQALIDIANTKIRLEYQNPCEPLKIRRKDQIRYSTIRILRLIIKCLIAGFLWIFGGKWIRPISGQTNPTIINVYAVEQDDERRTYYE